MTQAVGFPDGALAVQWHVALSLALQVKYLHAHHIGLHRGIKEAPCRPESALQATAIFPWRAPRAETPFSDMQRVVSFSEENILLKGDSIRPWTCFSIHRVCIWQSGYQVL